MEEQEELREYADNLDVEQIDLLMEILINSKEERGRKHIPGRYGKIPFYKISFRTGEMLNIEKDSDTNNGWYIKMARTLGCCSETPEEAEFIDRQQKAYLKLIDEIHELNKGWEPDWSDEKQSKYNFRCNGRKDGGCQRVNASQGDHPQY